MRNLLRLILFSLLLSSVVPLLWIHADAAFAPLTPDNIAQLQVVGSRLWPWDFDPTGLRFSPDGKKLIMDTGSSWRLWNLNDDTELDLGPDRFVLFSPDWEYVVRTHDYSTYTLYSFSDGLKSANPLVTFPESSDFIF